MSLRLNAFVPAAGIGERLRPITEHLPKPMLPILGKSLLARTMERVSALPIGRIGLNLHHKPDPIVTWSEASPYRGRIILFPERRLLGTGGALKNAASLLEEGVFLVHNADIFTDIDLAALVEFHQASGNIVTLALHDSPTHNKVGVDEAGEVVGVNGYTMIPGAVRVLAYTGIAVYDAAFLKYLPAGPSNVVDTWLAAMAAGWAVGSVDVTGSLWHDCGTPASYAAAVVDALRRDGEWVHIGNGIQGRGVSLDGYVVAEEGCTVNDGAVLRNCIALPGAHIVRGVRYENCIVGGRFHLQLAEAEFLGLPVSEHGIPIGVGGSGRRYYRAQDSAGTIVRMVCPPDETDYERHIAYSRFFARHGVPVPRLLRVEPVSRQAEFEDLGDLSLYNYLQFPRTAEEVEDVYQRVLNSLISLHVDAYRHVGECNLLANRLFDYDYFRWETSYFLERFVEGLRGIRLEARDALEHDFDCLARTAVRLPKVIIHRDLQSQNIMITNGGPRLIDYQGARIASPAYDITSVLWDPYYRLDDAMRERLVAHYIGMRTRRADADFCPQDFLDALVVCRLQRHMQALGAYGFLSVVKGKQHFLKYVPEGVRLLKEDVAAAGETYPAIAALVEKL